MKPTSEAMKEGQKLAVSLSSMITKYEKQADNSLGFYAGFVAAIGGMMGASMGSEAAGVVFDQAKRATQIVGQERGK